MCTPQIYDLSKIEQTECLEELLKEKTIESQTDFPYIVLQLFDYKGVRIIFNVSLIFIANIIFIVGIIASLIVIVVIIFVIFIAGLIMCPEVEVARSSDRIHVLVPCDGAPGIVSGILGK